MKNFLYLCFVVLTALIVLTACDTSVKLESALQAVRDFHDQLDAEQFKTIYDQSSDDLKKMANQQDFTALLDAVHRKLGKTKSLELTSKSMNYSPSSGKTIVLEYHTVYAQGDATESFSYLLEDNAVLLNGYHINSNALILK